MSSTPTPTPALPALYLCPLNNSFAPKCIPLAGGTRVPLGRACGAPHTAPTRANGRFPGGVLSRAHAEVWAQDGAVFVRDVQSQNGTYVNGARLAAERATSPPAVLRTGDELVLGFDIFDADGVRKLHHRVAARVVCAFTADEARAAELAAFVPGALGGEGGAGVMAAL
ncbi:FHA domain-containing protein [Phanerochaete sordida]|uniref:FHA domain-containing protein n=1 Tax=Phanerochaete sordida TaxID=48140 RepID=A0A9P3LKQ4_9APHY|nr:FHA domain-containing protein [Phanerochaete sordida]